MPKVVYQLVAPSRHSIDGADGGGGLVDAIEMLHHVFLVRDRHGDLAQAQRADAGDRIAEALGRDVEGEVGCVQTQRPECSIVHGRRAGVAGRM